MTRYCQGAWRDAAGAIHHAAGCDLPHGSAPDASHVTSTACREIFRRWFRGEDVSQASEGSRESRASGPAIRRASSSEPPECREQHELTGGGKGLPGATTEPRAKSRPASFRGVRIVDSEGRAQAVPLQGGKAGDSNSAARAPLSESQEAAA